MTTKTTLLAAVLLLCGCQKEVSASNAIIVSHNVSEWEHGWRTTNVIATRYSNPHMGYNIGFTFPGHENDCDRAEICDYIKGNGGAIYQCGGYPGAEMFAVFSGVSDKATANAKLKEILPGLDAVVETL